MALKLTDCMVTRYARITRSSRMGVISILVRSSNRTAVDRRIRKQAAIGKSFEQERMCVQADGDQALQPPKEWIGG